MKYNVKDMVKDGKKVRFVYYRHNELWYETECGFKFPVDISDTGDGTFLAEDKAMMFMRYIKKAIKGAEESLNQETLGAISDSYNGNLETVEHVGNLVNKIK